MTEDGSNDLKGGGGSSISYTWETRVSGSNPAFAKAEVGDEGDSLELFKIGCNRAGASANLGEQTGLLTVSFDYAVTASQEPGITIVNIRSEFDSGFVDKVISRDLDATADGTTRGRVEEVLSIGSDPRSVVVDIGVGPTDDCRDPDHADTTLTVSDFTVEPATIDVVDSPVVTRPIQVIGETRIAGTDDNVRLSADMVAGRQTAILFGLDVPDMGIVPSVGDVLEVTASVQGETDSVTLSKRDIEPIRDATGRELPEVFSRRISDDPPVLELPDGDGYEIRIDAEFTSSRDIPVETGGTALTEGLDFTVEAPPTPSPRIAVAEIADPDGGSNYGGNDGRLDTDLTRLVDDLRDMLEERFPVVPGRPELMELGQPIEGTVSSGDWRVDAKRAYDELDGVYDANATLLFVPDDYFDFHDRGTWAGVHPSFKGGNAQPQKSAIAEEDVETALHELAHHYVGEFYPEAAAQRDDTNKDGNADTTDPKHARTFRRLDDDPGLVSTGRVVFDANGGYSVSGSTRYPEPASLSDVPEVPSILSYDFIEKVPDANLFNFLASGGYTPRPPEKSGGSGFDIPFLSVSAERTGGTFAVTDTAVRSGAPTPSDPDGDLTVTVTDGSGTTLAERQVSGSLVAHPSAADDGSETRPSTVTLEGSTAFVVEFPEAAAQVRISHEDGTEATFEPLSRTLRDLVGRTPDRAFAGDATGIRGDLVDRLDAVERRIANAAYPAARDGLEAVRGTIRDQIRGGYEPTFAGEPTREELLTAVDDRLDRLGTVAGGLAVDEYGALYREGSVDAATTVTATVATQEDTGPDAKAGVMVRNEVEAAGEATGYVVCGVTPTDGFLMEWDADGDGYLDTTRRAGETSYPCRLRLRRDGDEFTGAYSVDGETWTRIAAVTLTDAAGTQDAGMFVTSGTADETSEVEFEAFGVESD